MLRSIGLRHGLDSKGKQDDDRPVALKAVRRVICARTTRESPRPFSRKRSFRVHASSSLSADQQKEKGRPLSSFCRDQPARVIFPYLAKALVDGDFKKPLDLFVAMDETKIISTVDHCNELLIQLRKVHATNAMFEFLKYMKQRKKELSESIYALIISACGMESNVERASLYFGQLKNSPAIPVTVRSYQAIITACVSCHDFEMAQKYLDEMVEAGVKLDALAFQPALRTLGYEKQQGVKAADLCTAVMKEMGRQGVRPTPDICRSALWTYSNAGYAKPLIAVYESAKQLGIKFGLDTYNSVLYCLGKRPEYLKQAVQVFEDIKRNDIQPVPYTYHLTLRVCAAARDEVQGLALLEEMEQAGLVPTLLTYNSVINCFIKKFPDAEKMKAWKSLEDLLNKMSGQRIEPDPVTFSVLLSVCLTNEDRDRAEKYFEAIKAAGVPRDKATFVRMIQLYAQSSDADCTLADVERISALLEQMEREGFQLDGASCYQLMQSLAKSKSTERAQPILEKILQTGVNYDSLLLMHLLEFCVSVDEREMLTDVVDSALEQKNLSEGVIYTTLLKTLIHFKKVTTVIEQLQKMKAGGVQFSTVMYTALDRLDQCDVSEEERAQINDILGRDSPFQQS